MRKVLFDSDLLGDDFYALDSLIHDDEFKLLGLTSFGRRRPAIERAKMAQVFLEDRGAKGIDIVPGADRPLLRETRPGCNFCDNAMLDILLRWNDKEKYSNNLIKYISAAEYIVRKSKEEGRVSLLCTGPMTNIALAVSLDPTLTERVDEIVIMGGLRTASGNASPVAEANILNDPDAASIVFSRFKSIVVIPLDLTLKVAITGLQADEINYPFLKDVSCACCESHVVRGDGSFMPLHDWLAFMALKDRTLFEFNHVDIKIETSSQKSLGRMIFSNDGEGSQLYARKVDVDSALDYFLKEYGGLDERA